MSNTVAFERVEVLAEDFLATLQAIQAANKEQGEIITAAYSRMTAERERAEKRKAELQAAIGDKGRSATVRGLAQSELDTMDATKYGPTAAERGAFDRATQRGEQAVADLRKTRDELRTALSAATAELSNIRAETIGKTDTDLCARWIEGQKAKFDRL